MMQSFSDRDLKQFHAVMVGLPKALAAAGHLDMVPKAQEQLAEIEAELDQRWINVGTVLEQRAQIEGWPPIGG